ncbi:MAG: DUF2950 domain-containing protein [Acidobacteriota bacterium]
MKATIQNRISHRNAMGALIVLSCAVGLALPSSVAAWQSSTNSSTVVQQAYDTPDAAAEALIHAAAPFDVAALEIVLGPHGEDLIASGDPVQDKNTAVSFAALATAKHSIRVDPKNPNRAALLVGTDEWPLPIPLVKQNGKWLFDTKAGREEILLRRIGRNELDAIEICRGYVDAQEEYALEKHDGVNQYAQRIISSPGKRDGLVWRNTDGTLGGPISEGIAEAIAQGYALPVRPFHGYLFKILKGQGSAAPLGQMNFVVEGSMIGGFALVAAPAEYGVTGVKTFIVSYEGVVYEKDFGANTLQNFRDMQFYNPDNTWKPTDANWPPESFDIATTTQDH